MSEWLSFRTQARGAAFADALAAFKASVPSTSRRWDGEHRYWLFDPGFAEAVSAIESVAIQPAVSLAEDDRRHARVPVCVGEQIDTELVDLQYGDTVASDGIGRIQGDKAARAEFERRLREASS